MKIIRYFQSCLLIEDGGTRILLDPSGQEDGIDKFGKIDAVIFTHEHIDHFDADIAQQLADAGAQIYANAATAKQMKSQPNIVADSQEFTAGSLKVKAVEIPHCLMVDGSTSVQNTGYLINGRFFTPGDGVVGAEGVQAEILAVPITGPDISLKDAFSFIKQIAAKHVIPIHYDFIGTKPDFLARSAKDFELKVLNGGESVEL